ncbi:MAG TPA: hypothetical protein VIM14_18145 [Polyangia bacterium]
MNALASLRSTASVVLLALLFWTVDAWAANVILVQPPGPSPAMAEAIVRVRGELISEGFQVEVLDGPKGEQSLSWLEQLAETRKADAVVAMFGDETPDSVEVWVVDQVTDKTVVRRIPLEPQSDHAPKTFAIHALELLRASFLEIGLRPTRRRGEAKSSPPATVHLVDSEASERGRFGVAIGGAAVLGLGNVGPALLPVMRIGLAISPSLVAQLAVAGYGSQASVQDDAGSARVAEEFALLGACYRFRPGRHLRPTISLAAGVLHTRAEGEATSAYRGLDAALWSFLLDGGVGVGLALAWGFEVAFATHAQIADPYPAIRFARSVVATSTRPSLLFTLTIGAWL